MVQVAAVRAMRVVVRLRSSMVLLMGIGADVRHAKCNEAAGTLRYVRYFGSFARSAALSTHLGLGR
jgi:hypothetical protein